MITIDIFEAVKFYKEVIERIKRENLNPFEFSIEEIKALAGDNILTNGIKTNYKFHRKP